MKNKILYCDTNILRYLIDHPKKHGSFYAHVSQSQTIVGISLVSIVELRKIPRYYEGLGKLVFGMRFSVLKWWKIILEEEVDLYPATNLVDPLLQPLLSEQLTRVNGESELQILFAHPRLDTAWNVFDEQKGPYMKVVSWLPSTRPRSTADMNLDYSLHNYGVVVSELRENRQPFLGQFKINPEALEVDLFRGSFLRAAYIYNRYILKGKGKKPAPSDIGDLHQVFYMPYCSEVIIERSMAGFLYELKKAKGLLPETEIRSIDFVRELPDN